MSFAATGTAIQRKRFAGSKRAMKTSGWLLCSRAKAESASIKLANTYRKRSAIRRINWACAFVHGQDIRSKMHPFKFYDSTYHLLTVMMYCIFRAIRLFPVSEKLEAEMQDLERGLAALWGTTSWDHGHEPRPRTEHASPVTCWTSSPLASSMRCRTSTVSAMTSRPGISPQSILINDQNHREYNRERSRRPLEQAF